MLFSGVTCTVQFLSAKRHVHCAVSRCQISHALWCFQVLYVTCTVVFSGGECHVHCGVFRCKVSHALCCFQVQGVACTLVFSVSKFHVHCAVSRCHVLCAVSRCGVPPSACRPVATRGTWRHGDWTQVTGCWSSRQSRAKTPAPTPVTQTTAWAAGCRRSCWWMCSVSTGLCSSLSLSLPLCSFSGIRSHRVVCRCRCCLLLDVDGVK